MSGHKTIYAVANKLGLDDDGRRAIYERVTGKAKLTLMSSQEQDAVVAEFRRLGGDRRPDGRLKLTGPYARKLQALWISAWNLGIVANRDDAALLAFVKRQTGIDHTRFLANAADAKKAIEALKKWIGREGGVSFGNTNGEDWLQRDIAKVCWAQWRMLEPEAELYPDTKGFPAEACKLAGCAPSTPLGVLKPADWRTISNALGKRIRARKAGV